MNDAPEKPGLFKQIFHHPNFNVVCGLVTIISAVLAIYFYNESITKPNLMYYISPTRTPIIQMGNLQRFSITFLGTSITNDVSTATVQLWNEGKQPVREGDILKPITLSTAHGEPIYQITVSSTRDVIGGTCEMLNVPSTNIPSAFKINWHILEHNDAIKIQLVYGGDVDVPLLLDGVVVGQKALVQYKDRSDSTNSILSVLAPVSWFALLMAMIITLDPVVKRMAKTPFTYKFTMVVSIVVLAILIVGCTGVLLRLLHYGPPFPT